jgi:hypothetical protein
MSLQSTFAQLSLAVTLVAVSVAPALAQDAFGSSNQTEQNSMVATGEQAGQNYTKGSQT